MLDRELVIDHLLKFADDTDSELNRFVQDMLILIEFGTFDASDEIEEK